MSAKPEIETPILRVVREIEAERIRQIVKEGYKPKHDDEHVDASLAMAAACYCAPHRIYVKCDYADGTLFTDPWPWESSFDKRPYDGNVVRSNGSKGETKRRDLLVKAAALIVAEIERIDRAASTQNASQETP